MPVTTLRSALMRDGGIVSPPDPAVALVSAARERRPARMPRSGVGETAGPSPATGPAGPQRPAQSALYGAVRVGLDWWVYGLHLQVRAGFSVYSLGLRVDLA